MERSPAFRRIDQDHLDARQVLLPAVLRDLADVAGNHVAKRVFETAIEHARLCVQFRIENAQAFFLDTLCEFLVVELECANGFGWAGLGAARLGPARVEQMRVKVPILRRPAPPGSRGSCHMGRHRPGPAGSSP